MRPPIYRYFNVSAVWIMRVMGIICRTREVMDARLAPESAARAASITIQPWHKAAVRVSITSMCRLGCFSFIMACAATAAWYAPLTAELI